MSLTSNDGGFDGIAGLVFNEAVFSTKCFRGWTIGRVLSSAAAFVAILRSFRFTYFRRIASLILTIRRIFVSTSAVVVVVVDNVVSVSYLVVA